MSGPLATPPGPVPPWAAGLQPQVYPALLHTVTGGGGATPQVTFLGGAPQWGSGACCLVGVVPFAYGVCFSCPPFPCLCTLILVALPGAGEGGALCTVISTTSSTTTYLTPTHPQPFTCRPSPALAAWLRGLCTYRWVVSTVTRPLTGVRPLVAVGTAAPCRAAVVPLPRAASAGR